MKKLITLSFLPRHFIRIQSGVFAGNWAPVIPAYPDAELTIADYEKEAAQIQAEGGIVSFADAPASPEIWAIVNKLVSTAHLNREK